MQNRMCYYYTVVYTSIFKLKLQGYHSLHCRNFPYSLKLLHHLGMGEAKN